MPDVGQNIDHVMAMGRGFGTPSGGELVDVGRQWLGNEGRGRRIVDEVMTTAADFVAVSERLGVAPSSVEVLGADIERRLASLRQRI